MHKIPAPKPVDLKPYAPGPGTHPTLYGLPPEVKFCRKCVMSNQRPNSVVEYQHKTDSKKPTIRFDDAGVCDACRANEQKQKINWDERERELRELCDRYRSKDGSYDCLVPGSGGKDSFYASHMLKYKYGMNPLTITWAPHIYTDWGWKNFQAWIHAGFDNFLCTPNGRVHRLLTRLAMENLLHPFQPFIFGQKSLAPKLSVLHKIPLVFYGESETEYGNPLADLSSARQNWNYYSAADKSKVFLSGQSIQDLRENFGLNENDLDIYMPANPDLLEKTKTEVHYLGYYLRWHPQNCYYYTTEHSDWAAAPERNPGTYGKYASIDDRVDDFHFYTTFIKFGIGHATYDASQEIRNGEIEREEGVALVKKFDGEFPERFAEEIFRYLSIPAKEFPVAAKMFEQPVMDRQYFETLIDRFRSPHLWMNDHGKWKLRHRVFDQT